jgi:hypothetical protein
MVGFPFSRRSWKHRILKLSGLEQVVASFQSSSRCIPLYTGSLASVRYCFSIFSLSFMFVVCMHDVGKMYRKEKYKSNRSEIQSINFSLFVLCSLHHLFTLETIRHPFCLFSALPYLVALHWAHLLAIIYDSPDNSK